MISELQDIQKLEKEYAHNQPFFLKICVRISSNFTIQGY
jgi:hypothetical protein